MHQGVGIKKTFNFTLQFVKGICSTASSCQISQNVWDLWGHIGRLFLFYFLTSVLFGGHSWAYLFRGQWARGSQECAGGGCCQEAASDL